MSLQAGVRLSADDFYALPAYLAGERLQLVDGEVYISVPPVPKHQAIVGEVLFLLLSYAKAHGGRAFTAPIELYLDDQHVFESDVLYLAPNSPCRIEEKRLVGAPSLVVEVLSPSTAKIDRQAKYLAYEAHGVGEYWLIDPAHDIIEVWTLQEGRYTRLGVYGRADTLNSPTLGVPVAVNALLG
jgi:Uma2 family endonuclease